MSPVSSMFLFSLHLCGGSSICSYHFLVLFDFVYWLNEKLVDCSCFLIIISCYFTVLK